MKRLRYENGEPDRIDVVILEALAADGRVSVAELARRVGLSPPSTAERIRRLEEAGVIAGYGARIDARALGLKLTAWLRIRPIPGELKAVADILRGLAEVVECDRVTGEDCFVARAHVESMEHLERLIDRLTGHAMTNTAIVQSSPVAPRLPPLQRRGRLAAGPRDGDAI